MMTQGDLLRVAAVFLCPVVTVQYKDPRECTRLLCVIIINGHADRLILPYKGLENVFKD